MITWFEISINGGVGYMKMLDGAFSGYYDTDGNVILAEEGTSVHVTANDVTVPF